MVLDRSQSAPWVCPLPTVTRFFNAIKFHEIQKISFFHWTSWKQKFAGGGYIWKISSLSQICDGPRGNGTDFCPNTSVSRSMKTDNSPIERVEEFRYLGTTLTNQNSIQEEIKSRLKLGNACYYSVQNHLSSRLLSKNLKIKTYRTIILPVVLYECETWSLTLREERIVWE